MGVDVSRHPALLRGTVRPKSGRSLDRLVAPLGAEYGHDEIVRDLLLGCASLLVFGNATLNVVMFESRRRRYRGVPWRARFAVEMRHHPRALVIQLVSLALAFVLLISYVVTLFA
jgi:hypothetical protein